MLKLPDEIFPKILSFTRLVDVINMSRTNTKLLKILKYYIDQQLYIEYHRGKSYESSQEEDIPFNISKDSVIYYNEIKNNAQLPGDYILVYLDYARQTYNISLFFDEVDCMEEYSPDYYGWDYNDQDKKVIRKEFSYNCRTINELFSYLKTANIDIAAIKYSYKFFDEYYYSSNEKVFRLNGKNQLDINIDKYYRIYIDGNNMLKILYEAAEKGKHIYVLNQNGNEDLLSTKDIKIIKYHAKFYGLSNIHICNHVCFSEMDAIFTNRAPSYDWSCLSKSPYHPDIYTRGWFYLVQELNYIYSHTNKIWSYSFTEV